MTRGSVLRRMLTLASLAGLAATACSQDDVTAPGGGGGGKSAELAFVLLVPGSNAIATISVEISGPGIDSLLVYNFAVVNGVASGTARVTVGAGRRIEARAFDATGVNTHRGDTTVTVLEGANPPVNLVMLPLIGGVPITLSFGTAVVSMGGNDTTLLTGDTLQLVAAAVSSRGGVIQSDSLVWASRNPAIASVTATGLVTAHAAGITEIVASHEGVSARRQVTVAQPTAGTGLLAYFPFSGNALDSTGNGWNGTVVGAASLTADRFGAPARAFQFNGGHIAIGDLDLPGAFTLAAWVRMDASVGGYGIVSKLQSPGSGYELLFVGTPGGPRLRLHTGLPPGSDDSSPWWFTDYVTPYGASQWYFVTATRDGAGMARLYRDGVLVATKAGISAVLDNPGSTFIGKSQYGGNPFSGAIDEVRIYNRALSAPEVAALYSQGGPLPPIAVVLAPVAGDGQTGAVGYATNVRPAVVVTANAAPAAGVEVTFAAQSGGGNVVKSVDTTDLNGIAQVGAWVLGAAPGGNTLSASVTDPGHSGAPLTFTATGAARQYSITLLNIGPPLSAPAQAAFDSAKAKWERVIYGDLPDIPLTINSGQCGNSTTIGPTTVDDVLILLELAAIDGPGGILGQAGPCLFRSAGSLPVAGIMQFDTADVAGLINSGQFADVILHEMGHILGLGTIWTFAAFNCLQSPSSVGAPQDTYYSCPAGRQAFDSLGGTSYTGGQKVPVENCGPASPGGCGGGTINGHWREPTFYNELMTGYLNIGVANPLSLLTAASLGDLGYQVNHAAADPYSQIFAIVTGIPGPSLFLGDDIYRGPLGAVDEHGQVTPVTRP